MSAQYHTWAKAVATHSTKNQGRHKEKSRSSSRLPAGWRLQQADFVLARKLAVELASIKPQMSKAAIPFAVPIAALFASSTPAFAKGGGNSAAKVSAKTSDHKSATTPTKITKKPSLTASKPPASNASGAGAGRPPG
jgi:hypothetical protein